VIDTAKTDDPMNVMSTGNSFMHFSNKTVNENHNSRVSIFVAQEYLCGIGIESKLSTSTGRHESYVALRLGNHLDSDGTIRGSTFQLLARLRLRPTRMSRPQNLTDLAQQ